LSDASEHPLFPDQPLPPNWVTVASVGELVEGQGKAFNVGKRMIAVFLHQGQYYAIDDFCPHQGASLAEGYISDCAIACPWHHWRFSLADGTWLDNPKLGVQKFSVRVHNGQIQVEVPEE
jgi:nitrite reductase (NADH) small subunit